MTIEPKLHPPIEVSFAADETAARGAILKIMQALNARAISPDESGRVELVMAEVINNVVEHAYAGKLQGQITIRCTHRPGALDVQITDQGRPFPDIQLPDGVCASVDTDFDDLPEGGFGWFLIFQLTEGVQYTRDQDTNKLDIKFDLAQDAPPDQTA
jgi:serine/threonine-protein kinase RsbW